MGAGESGVTEIQAQIDDAVQGQIQQAISEVVPQTEKKEKKENSQQVEFVTPKEILNNLSEICQKMGSLEKKEKEEKKEEYQINNSDEISGFNLRMK